MQTIAFRLCSAAAVVAWAAAITPLNAQARVTIPPPIPITKDASSATNLGTVVPFVPPSTPPTPALTVFQAALKEAVATHKGVFIRFGASWCGWCHKLDAFLKTPEGLELDKYLVIDELIVQESGEKKVLENAGGDSLFKAWGGTGGIPFFAFFDAKGTKLSDANGMPDKSNIGYPANPKEDSAFDAVLKKGIPALPDSVRARIMDYIVKHP